MNEIVPIGCAVLFVVVGIPVWSIAQARRARREIGALRAERDEIFARLRSLEEAVRPSARVAEEVSAPFVPRPAEPPPAPAAIPLPPLPAPEPARAGTAPPPPPPAARMPASPVLPPPPSRKSFDWETLISVRAFAWLGGAALFLGMALFLQYSIQHNLISPAARVAIGLLVGAAALAGGDSLRSRAAWAGQATSGAGVAILYASLFAAHARYALLDSTATFAGMAFVTLTAGLLAARRKAFIVAVLGLVGGFLTPWLLATNEDHPIALFIYVLLLDAGAIALARRRRWTSIQALALLASAILFAGWAQRHMDAGKAPFALVAAAILSALFAARRIEVDPEHPDGKEWAGAIRILAAIGPLVLALLVSGSSALAVSPAFLVGDLLILSAGAFLIANASDFAPLLPIAAGFSVATLVARVGPDLRPDRSLLLALFTLVPAGFVALGLWSAKRPAAAAARAAAAISLAGGFLVLVRFLEVHPSAPALPLWLFAAAHALGFLAIATQTASGRWILGSQALLYASLVALVVDREAKVLGRDGLFRDLPEFLPLILGPVVVFWALPFLSGRWRRDRQAWLSSALAPIVHFPVLFILARPTWGPEKLGGVAVLFAIAALAALRRSSSILASPEDKRFTTALFGAVTLLFITAAIPIVLDKQWITVAWALEAAALAWLWRRVPEEALIKASAALAAASFARLVMNPALWSYHPRSGTPIVNWYLYTFGVPCVALLAAARLIRGSEYAERHRLPAIFSAAAGVLAFMLVNVEIADFYSKGPTLVFRLSGGGLAEDVTYSLAWGVFALVLLALGITRSSKPMRAAALLVLLLTIGKVFLHDLWDLGALYRVGSIVGLAVALLAVSFLTQRFVFSREEGP
jgi:uncharacterized membrane protein